MNERDIAPDERAAGLFQPDTLTPSQFFDRTRRSSEHDGERRLMIAVLEDAIAVYRKRLASPDRRSRELFVEAEAWIESHDRQWFFSFENICAVLDLDADYIRSGLRRWKRNQLAGGPGRVIVLRAPQDTSLSELRTASAQN